MHIPDHYLDPATCAATAVLAGGSLFYAGARFRTSEIRPSLTAFVATTATIFAGQMVNYPIAVGTSGHLLGAALAVVLLGPWAGILSLAVVVAVQALVFGDGGLSALGANLLNMAVIAPLTAHMVLRSGDSEAASAGRAIWAGGAAILSILVAAAACALELALAGDLTIGQTLAAVMPVHLLIGLSEGAITAAAILAVNRVRTPSMTTAGSRVALAVVPAVLIAALLAPLASEAPDGLESAAHSLGIGEGESLFSGVIPDYAMPGLPELIAVSAAGLVGVAIVAVVAVIIGYGANGRSARAS